MRWDIFCRVIDNHGDLGVCWRLAAQLAAAGDTVRLWVDDGTALAWMAPGGHPGVQLIDWSDEAAVRTAVAAPPPEVLIEAFGCDPEPALVERFAASAGPRRWINLEYLSAEAYVARSHGLPSPVFHGPGAGLTKHFFYPGFSAATGGLLREPDLAQRLARFDRAAWLRSQAIDWRGERLVSLFCYDPPALAGLLDAWAEGDQPTLLLVTPGRAARAVHAARPQGASGHLRIHPMPALTQPGFDELLWACDLNLVRGEDSLVRALWAGRAMAWQIYPQDDDAHHDKLDAWLDAIDAPASMRRFHAAWNGIATGPAPAGITAPDAATLAEWQASLGRSRAGWLAQPDLLSQLRRFVSPPER
ncbi:elongation factor P maturation arginine rhamnosyltransferase EarP [Xylophilus sp. Kf1]|nr:elongation factor P maturation arginine rhamnosyltransferase EarP [Xylophilus sp. Kf1]